MDIPSTLHAGWAQSMVLVATMMSSDFPCLSMGFTFSLTLSYVSNSDK